MHFDFIAEGWKPDLDKMEEWLNTRTFDMPVINKDGKKVWIKVHGALRPRRAYTYVFPRGALDEVMKTMKPDDCINTLKDHKQILGGVTNFIRRVLRLDKMPKIKDVKEFPMMIGWNKNLRILGLGTRKDEDIKFPSGITHEGL